MASDGDYTQHREPWAMHRIVESVRCVPKDNITLYVHYSSTTKPECTIPELKHGGLRCAHRSDSQPSPEAARPSLVFDKSEKEYLLETLFNYPTLHPMTFSCRAGSGCYDKCIILSNILSHSGSSGLLWFLNRCHFNFIFLYQSSRLWNTRVH